MATINAINSSIPIEITKGVTNATSFSTANGIVKYDGTRLVSSSTATIDASNRITNTAQPAFLAYLSSTLSNVTGDGTWYYPIIFDQEIFDQGSNYNNATGIFTAPVTGKYVHIVYVKLSGYLAANVRSVARVYTDNRTYSGEFINGYACSASGELSLGCICLSDMDSGDTASYRVYVGDGTKVIDILQCSSSTDLVSFASCYLCC